MEVSGLDKLDNLLERPFFVFVKLRDEHAFCLPDVWGDGALHDVECRCIEADLGMT